MKLIIKYRYADGTQAVPKYVEDIEYGRQYNIASPEIKGYVASRKTVKGTMPKRNLTVTVFYTNMIGNSLDEIVLI